MKLGSARLWARDARRLLAIGMTLAAIGAATGCGGGGSSSTSSDPAEAAVTTSPATTATTPPTTATTPPTTATTPPTARRAPRGKATAATKAGKTVFVANCTGCHTLAEARALGTEGPNLDELQPDAPTVKGQVTTGGGGMPAFAGNLSKREIGAVAKYVAWAAGTDGH